MLNINDEVDNVLGAMIGDKPFGDSVGFDSYKMLDRAIDREQCYYEQQDKLSRKEAGFRAVHYDRSQK